MIVKFKFDIPPGVGCEDCRFLKRLVINGFGGLACTLFNEDLDANHLKCAACLSYLKNNIVNDKERVEFIRTIILSEV